MFKLLRKRAQMLCELNLFSDILFLFMFFLWLLFHLHAWSYLECIVVFFYISFFFTHSRGSLRSSLYYLYDSCDKNLLFYTKTRQKKRRKTDRRKRRQPNYETWSENIIIIAQSGKNNNNNSVVSQILTIYISLIGKRKLENCDILAWFERC